MPHIALIGNCQVETFTFLIEHMVPEAQVTALDFSEPAPYRQPLTRAFQTSLNEADIILVQPGGWEALDHQQIKTTYPNKSCSIAHLYFRGLHPDSCYVGSITDRMQNPSLYHSVAVLDAFRQGHSEKWALENAFTGENFQRLGLLEAWDSSIEELQRRDTTLDVPAGALVQTYCHQYPGFLTFNHPTIGLVYEYLKLVFAHIGQTYRPTNMASLQDPLARQDTTPIHDTIADYYQLPYRTTQHWFIDNLGKIFIDKAEYIHRFYAQYKLIDSKKLLVHSPTDMVTELRKHHEFAYLTNY